MTTTTKIDTNAKFKVGIKARTIGVEIEFTGLTRKTAADVVANYLDMYAEHVGNEYDVYQIIDKSGRKWQIMSDCSVLGERLMKGKITRPSNDYYYKCELVTPILRWDDIETLQGVVKAIVAAGGFVNKTCGLHVHIGGNGLTAQDLRNLLNIVGSRENLFYEAFAVHEVRKSFCCPTSEGVIRAFNEKKPSTLEEAKNIWYNGRVSRAERHYDDSRYTICNLHAFFNKGTVEFRLFNGTLDADEVAAAIHFSAALVDMAKRKSRTVYEVFNDRAFERMSNFLGRLKLTGDEFKTTRYQILKHVAKKASRTIAA